MLHPAHPLAELLKEDRRYRFEAYVFVFEALGFGHNVLGMGAEGESEPLSEEPEEEEQAEEPKKPERHVSGQELCEAARQYALDQYGYMAKTVLGSWGIYSTSDFGEIVFNLIRIGQMRKTRTDRREDFDNVYDFETAFEDRYRIQPPD